MRVNSKLSLEQSPGPTRLSRREQRNGHVTLKNGVTFGSGGYWNLPLGCSLGVRMFRMGAGGLWFVAGKHHAREPVGKLPRHSKWI